MKWVVELYVAGKVFKEELHAVNYQDATKIDYRRGDA